MSFTEDSLQEREIISQGCTADNDINKENERLQQWAKEFYKYSAYGSEGRTKKTFNYTLLFKDQLLEYKLFEKLEKYFSQVPSRLKVLDIGCGEGRWLRKLIEFGFSPANLFGIDINEDIIELGKTLSSPQISFTVGKADELDFENETFDIVLMIGVLQHVLNNNLQRNIRDEVLRVLKKGGIFITYNITPLGHGYFPDHLYHSTMGVDQPFLEELFAGCSIEYEPFLLNDLAIELYAKNKWNELYEKALDSHYGQHHYGLAVIQKQQ
jgi:ubiquinone/menaquinone biosynthesis C-methylase UbiE